MPIDYSNINFLPFPRPSLDISHQRFGRLKVLGFVGKQFTKRSAWLCECDCGTLHPVVADQLKSGNTSSCGCLEIENRIKHGNCSRVKKTPEYTAWQNMIARCENSNRAGSEDYIGRGVTVCPEWRNDFLCFLKDVGKRPSLEHSLDRFPDNNGNYERGNTRWAIWPDQNRNTRRNRWITFQNRTLCLRDWATVLNIDYSTLRHRLSKNPSVEKAFTDPINQNYSRKQFTATPPM